LKWKRKWKRIVMVGIFVLATLIFALSRFYLNVQGNHWDEKSAAVETAYEKSVLAKASKVESFYGDQPMHIVFGEDKIGHKVIVWVTDKDVHAEMADDAFTEEQVREIMLKKDPNLELMRVMPGFIEGQYVWEVFYKKQIDGGTRYFYDYYKFHDGTYIDTYRLSLH
jgi:uncharacterized protein YpmB